MRLKHFPTGLLRCGISKRKAKLFVTALMVAATAQTCFAQTTGTETSGRNDEQPIAAWSGTTLSAADKKTVYLYNVGTKQFAEAAYGHVSPRLETATSDMFGIPADSTAYSKWVIVTEDQRKDAFKTVNNAHVAAVNATFLMSDFDFARNDTKCSEWMTGATTN